MAITPSTYQLTLVATRGDGVTTSSVVSVVIGDGLSPIVVSMGVVNNNINLNSLTPFVEDIEVPIEVIVPLSSISHTYTLPNIVSVIDSNNVVLLGLLNLNKVLTDIVPLIEAGPVNMEIGIINTTTSLYEVVPNDGLVTILSTTGFKLGEEFTVTYNNVDLSEYSVISLSINDIDLGAPLSSTSTTATFMAPSEGLAVNSTYNLKPTLAL